MKDKPPQDGPQGPDTDVEVREHLANERTLLAWVRTGVGLISVGFVVERAGAFAAGSSGDPAAASTAFGLALVGLGCLTLIVGSVEFFRNRRMISAGEFQSTAVPYMLVVVGSLVLAAAFVVYTVVRDAA